MHLNCQTEKATHDHSMSKESLVSTNNSVTRTYLTNCLCFCCRIIHSYLKLNLHMMIPKVKQL